MFIRVEHEFYEHKGNKGPRDWKDITGIVLHQTACRLGCNPPRWGKLGAHIGIPSDGNILLVNPLTTEMFHGNGFNSSTVGIEVDGNFCGVEGKTSTLWKKGGGPHTLTEEQIAGVREAIRWVMAEVAANGGAITHIFAHRQSCGDRENDPGSNIWRETGLWAQKELGLVNNPMYKRWTGLPIPIEWDPRSVVDYRCRLVPERVKWYQTLIGFEGDDVDGDHGGGTTEKLKQWQHEHGLKETGEVSAPTFEALENA